MFFHLMETLELHLVILYQVLQEMSRQFKPNQSEGVLEERNSKSISVSDNISIFTKQEKYS